LLLLLLLLLLPACSLFVQVSKVEHAMQRLEELLLRSRSVQVIHVMMMMMVVVCVVWQLMASEKMI
jgi:hypothetical protein